MCIRNWIDFFPDSSYHVLQVMKPLANSLLAFICCTLIACVNTKNIPMTKEHAALLKGHSMASLPSHTPDFVAATRLKGTLGLMGVVGMVAEGNVIIHENNVEDPAQTIAANLTKAIAGRYGIKMVNLTQKRGVDQSIAALSKAGQEADYLIDVKTSSWGCMYYPTGWDKYYLIYTANLQLIDTRTQTVLCQGYFTAPRKDKENASSYTGLMENQAAGLKQELKSSTEQAIHFFKTEILGL